MTKRDKKIVQAALDALEVYWHTHGVLELGVGLMRCSDSNYESCALENCVHCNTEAAWSAWEEAEDNLKKAIA